MISCPGEGKRLLPERASQRSLIPIRLSLVADLGMVAAFIVSACGGAAPEPTMRGPYAADPATGLVPDHVVIVEEGEFYIRITEVDRQPTGWNPSNVTLP